jgi:hypothetical protein
MPNWRIASSTQEEIVRNCAALTYRTVRYAEADFPLTTAQVQFAIMAEEHVVTMMRLSSEGVSLPRSNQVEVQIRCEDLPGLRRGIALKLDLPERVYEAQSSYWEGGKWDSSRHHRLNLDRLDDNQRAELATWCNRVSRAVRLKELVDVTVVAVLQYAPTAYHLQAAWPGLRAFIRDASVRDRLRCEPRSIKAYKPHAHINTPEFVKRIKASETILMQGQILDPYNHPERTIEVADMQWERLESDPKFT